MAHLDQKQAKKKLYADCRNGILRYANPGFSSAVNQLTVGALVRYPSGSSPAANDRLVHIDPSETHNVYLGLAGTNQNIRFVVDAGSAGARLIFDTATDEALEDDTWHTVIGTFDVNGFGADPVEDGDQASVYIDGVASGESAAMASGTDPLEEDEVDLTDAEITIAAVSNNGRTAEADYGTVVIAEQAVTAAEAAALHKAMLQKDPAGMFNIFSGESLLFLMHPTLQPGASLGGIQANISQICANLGWARVDSGLMLPTGIAGSGGSGAIPVLKEYLGPIG